MLKTLGAQVKEFKKASVLTPVFMILEVIMETVIPLLMASIIDDGVEKGDIGHIYAVGGMDGSCGSSRALCRGHGRKIRRKGVHGVCKESEGSYV